MALSLLAGCAQAHPEPELQVVNILDDSNASWAVPLLTLLVGYVIGNAQVTDQLDNIAPIVSTKPED